MCNSIFIGCFCVVFHCNTYKLYRPFSIQIVIHIGLVLLLHYSSIVDVYVIIYVTTSNFNDDIKC